VSREIKYEVNITVCSHIFLKSVLEGSFQGVLEGCHVRNSPGVLQGVLWIVLRGVQKGVCVPSGVFRRVCVCPPGCSEGCVCVLRGVQKGVLGVSHGVSSKRIIHSFL
jgi:hypothetical protein